MIRIGLWRTVGDICLLGRAVASLRSESQATQTLLPGMLCASVRLYMIVPRFVFSTLHHKMAVQESYLNVWAVHFALWVPPDPRPAGRASREGPGACEVRAATSSDCSQTPRGEKLQRSNSRGAAGDGRQRWNVRCWPVAFALFGSHGSIHYC